MEEGLVYLLDSIDYLPMLGMDDNRSADWQQ